MPVVLPRSGLRRGLCFCVIAACFLALAGCVSSTFVRDPLRVAAKPGEGSVVVSLTTNTGEVNQMDVIELEEMSQLDKNGLGRFYVMNRVGGRLSRDTSLFAARLPAGRYRFRILRDMQPQNLQGSVYLPLNLRQIEGIGEFTVEAGAHADLGRLVITAVNTKVAVGRSQEVVANRALIERHAPAYLELSNAPAKGGWVRVAPPDNGDIERFAMARPQGATGFSELSTGEVIGGSRMGSVLLRGTDGQWRKFARTGTLDAVAWTLPYEIDGHVAVIAGDLGTLALVGRDGSVHQVDTGDLPHGNLFFVDRSADGAQWIVGVSDDRQGALYASSKLDGGSWTRMRGDSIDFSVWSGQRSVWAWRRPGGIGFASSQTPRIACYDYAARQWSERDTPGRRKLFALSPGAGDALGVLTTPGGGLVGLFASSFYSLNCGVAWAETRSPYKVKVMPPLALASGRLLEGGGVFRDTGLYASQVGSDVWTKLGVQVNFNENVWVLPKAGLLAVTRGADGFEVIQHSSDEGGSWTVEMSSFDLRRGASR